MPDYLAELRAGIETRVREQIERHLRVDPRANIARIVELQMRQEEERLERLIDEADDNPEQGEALIALLGLLPQIEEQLTRRNR
jgi:hypothetical protein